MYDFWLRSWWLHPMETFPRYWPFVRGIHRLPVNSPHKGQWRATLMFSLICAWTNAWVYNCEAGDLRRHCTHYDVAVMYSYIISHQLCIQFRCADALCFAVAISSARSGWFLPIRQVCFTAVLRSNSLHKRSDIWNVCACHDIIMN